MKLTVEEIRNRLTVAYPLEITNYLLRLFGSGVYMLHNISDQDMPADFRSFCSPADHVACVSATDSVIELAIICRTLKDINSEKVMGLTSCVYPLTDYSVLHIAVIGSILCIVQAKYSIPVRTEEAGLLDKQQAIDLARRLVGESYNVR